MNTATKSSNFSSTTTNPKVRYEIVRPHQLPLVHQLLYQSFYPDEPLTRHLGLNRGAFSIPDLDKMAEDAVLNHNLSIIALDASNNKPLGLVLNGEFHKKDLETTREEVVKSCIDPAFVPIALILHECQQRAREAFEAIDSDVIFYAKIGTITQEARGLGLANDLGQRLLMLAKCLGYKGIYGEVTNTYSWKAAEMNGMQVASVVRYDEFNLDGRKVFSGIDGHRGCASMICKL